MFNEFIQLLLRKDKFDEPQPGNVGGEDQDGRYAIQVPEDLNNIYVRLLAGDRQTSIEARNINVPIQPDYPVLIYYVKGIKTPYAIPDPSREAEYRNQNEGLSTVAPHSHEPGFGNFDPVSTIRMREGQPSLSFPYSMAVDIAPLKYWDLDGVDQWFPGGSIDLTSYVPATADTHLMCKVVLNRTTGGLEAFVGDEKSILVPLTEFDLASIETGGSYKNLCGVRLHEGMTEIDDMKYVMDWRFWIADFAEGASGVSGVSVGELADLADVLSASQLANYVLAAGDGTTGGDYRGRLLVAADIPSLAASKITTGFLSMARGGLGEDVSTFDGVVRILSGDASYIKYNSTTTDPTVSDDSGDGYVVGSRWINTSTGEEFVATDVTVGSAVWVSTTNTSGLDELADLDDVSSAAQTANFVLAAGNGATGGDYRGRLLVDQDIPLLNTSHLDSGVLAYERGGLETDASLLDGLIQISGSATVSYKFTITNANPTTSDDSGSGYSIGSRWINTSTGEEFICVDATVTSAIWKSTTSQSSGGIGTFHGAKAEIDFTVISNSTPTELLFLSEVYDTDNYIDVGGASPNSIVIPSDYSGYYHIVANILASDTSGNPNSGTIDVEIVVNTTSEGHLSFFYDIDTHVVDQYISLSTHCFANVGDEISFVVTKNTGDEMGFTGFVMASLMGAT